MAATAPVFVNMQPGDTAPHFAQRSGANPRFVFDTAAGRSLTPVGGPTFTEPLRYQSTQQAAASNTGEIAFLRIRYKLPGQHASRLIERAISDADAVSSLAQAPEAVRWAAAVAGYGQLLRGDPYVARAYGWDEVITLAQSARGRDEDGWRNEFVQLARRAQRAPPLRTENRPPLDG